MIRSTIQTNINLLLSQPIGTAQHNLERLHQAFAPSADTDGQPLLDALRACIGNDSGDNRVTLYRLLHAQDYRITAG